jgi:multisubunit Na+/H+ antiporter MnhB subunit
VFPQFVGLVSVIGCLILLFRMRTSSEKSPLFCDSEAGNPEGNQHGLWATLAWFAGLLVLTSLVGFILALAGFLVAFIHYRAKRSLPYALAYGACGIAFMCAMAWLLNRDFPPGLLQSYADLPWPLT